MSRWLIVRSAAISPPSGIAFDAAYKVSLGCGPLTRDVVVEFTAPSRVVSVGYAEEVTRGFLANNEPPQHLTVDVAGKVHVHTGPRLTDEAAPKPPSVLEPRRARTRRHL
jgi:hypothetical protein